jgi:hypothetical protein
LAYAIEHEHIPAKVRPTYIAQDVDLVSEGDICCLPR